METISASTIMMALDVLWALPKNYAKPTAMWVEKNGDICMEWRSCETNDINIKLRKGKMLYETKFKGVIENGELDPSDESLSKLLSKGKFKSVYIW